MTRSSAPLKELRLRDRHGRALVQADAVEFRTGRFGHRSAWRYGTVVDEELRPSPRVLIQPDHAPGQRAEAIVGVSPQQVRQREGRSLPEPDPVRRRALPPLSGPIVVRVAGAAARAIPRPRRPARDGAYLDYVRSWACTSCGAPPPSEAHHVGPRGVSQKTDDYRTVPLCHACHRSVTDTGSLPDRDRTTTEAIFQRTKEDLLVAWCAGATAPAPSADERLAEALDGGALRRLAAVAGALLVLLLSAPAWAATTAPAPRSPVLPFCLFLSCAAALVLLCQRTPRRRSQALARPPRHSRGYAASLAYRRHACHSGPPSRPLPPPPPAERWAVPLLFLFIPAQAPAQPRPVPLVLGEQALQAGWPLIAWRRCQEAAQGRGPHRGAALACQGRAALSLHWPAEAQRLARAALREVHYPASAYVLLGDALRAERGRCTPEARTAYLDAAAALPGDAAAAAGLSACTVDAPDLAAGPPPSSERRPRRRLRRRRAARRPAHAARRYLALAALFAAGCAGPTLLKQQVTYLPSGGALQVEAAGPVDRSGAEEALRAAATPLARCSAFDVRLASVAVTVKPPKPPETEPTVTSAIAGSFTCSPGGAL